jgi:hypothetical protein
MIFTKFRKGCSRQGKWISSGMMKSLKQQLNKPGTWQIQKKKDFSA